MVGGRYRTPPIFFNETQTTKKMIKNRQFLSCEDKKARSRDDSFNLITNQSNEFSLKSHFKFVSPAIS